MMEQVGAALQLLLLLQCDEEAAVHNELRWQSYSQSVLQYFNATRFSIAKKNILTYSASAKDSRHADSI